jgi:WhiB family transcriptional regulator, redox-sensing transcriptional regulator
MRVKQPDFFTRGACKGSPPSLFYQFDTKKDMVAKQICKDCEVKEECLTYAINHNETGVWGGMNDKDRKQHVVKLYLQGGLEAALQRKTPHEQGHPANASPVSPSHISSSQTHSREPFVMAAVVSFQFQAPDIKSAKILSPVAFAFGPS